MTVQFFTHQRSSACMHAFAGILLYQKSHHSLLITFRLTAGSAALAAILFCRVSVSARLHSMYWVLYNT